MACSPTTALYSRLQPGLLTIHRDGAPQLILARGGFAEVSPTRLTLLAEQVTPAAEINPATLDQDIKDVQEDVNDGRLRLRATRLASG